MKEREKLHVVGSSVRKLDALALACGGPVFTDDVHPPGLLHARVLRSPHPHARIRSIETAEARAVPGVHAVVTHEDVPRIPFTTAGQGAPEPSPYDTFILDAKVRYVGDRVAAAVAETPEIAEEALSKIRVEWEVLEAVLDPEAALAEGAPVIHDEAEAHAPIPVIYEPGKNLAAAVHFEVGDVGGAFRDAHGTSEGTFHVHYGSHCALETHIAVAWVDASGRLMIRTSTQVPFHVRRIVARALGLPVKRVRVIKPRVGGGFGGKQEVLLEPLVAFLARTRHPQTVRMRAAADAFGHVTALDMDVLMNTGAYGSHGLTVLTNTGSKNLPLYRAEAVRFSGRTAYTNLPVGGAYRGYGATQGAFAMGVVMDQLAESLEMDPVDFHLLNGTRTGDTSPVFKALGEGKAGVAQSIGSCGLGDCIRSGAEAIGWEEKRKRVSGGPRKRGVGMTILMQGSSIPQVDMGAAFLKMNEDGTFNLLVGATDLGTGSDTVLAQIAAEVLGVEADDLIVLSSDTDVTPFDVGAYASSTTYLTGEAVRKAALDARGQVLEVAAKILEREGVEGLHIMKGGVRGGDREVPLSEIALSSLYERDQFQIQACASHITSVSPPPFAAHFAEVEVDTETGRITVIDYVAAVDCGTAIHPRLAEGQTEGAVLNGISYALYEEYLFDRNGRMRNPSFRDYKISSAADAPPIRCILVPTWEETGPFGAKSVSEISINGPLPAIANAVYHAVGIRLHESPFTPERVLSAWRDREGMV
ncbi:MAG: xanthine dehydrogenase family protein molybdopterin-binding subunit [Planctomycetota bacterium]|jgi:CO/xanthine dehydrogenase Mo-binding subunit